MCPCLRPQVNKLLAIAHFPKERQALHDLGLLAGVAELTADFLAFRPPTQRALAPPSPPPPRLPAAQAEAATSAEGAGGEARGGEAVSAPPGEPLLPRHGERTMAERPPPDAATEGSDRPHSPAAAERGMGEIVGSSVLGGSALDGSVSVEICRRVAARFGAGLETQLNVQGREALEQLRAVTIRSIRRLAAELYAGNVHFVLVRHGWSGVYHGRRGMYDTEYRSSNGLQIIGKLKGCADRIVT